MKVEMMNLVMIIIIIDYESIPIVGLLLIVATILVQIVQIIQNVMDDVLVEIKMNKMIIIILRMEILQNIVMLVVWIEKVFHLVKIGILEDDVVRRIQLKIVSFLLIYYNVS